MLQRNMAAPSSGYESTFKKKPAGSGGKVRKATSFGAAWQLRLQGKKVRSVENQQEQVARCGEGHTRFGGTWQLHLRGKKWVQEEPAGAGGKVRRETHKLRRSMAAPSSG
jgi:hypothetical protein